MTIKAKSQGPTLVEPLLALVVLIVVIAPMTAAQEPDEAWQRDLDIAGS
jgi:hypothetical protein